MKTSQLKILNYLTIPLLLSMGLASWMGIFNDNTYARETASFAAQGTGQDIVNIFIGGPVLLISLILMNRGNRTASFIFGGMIFYYLYSYIIYTFGLHHNSFFLIYCLTLALSTYTFIFWVNFHSGLDIKSWFKNAPPKKATAVFILIIAFMFYMLWLKDIVPALVKGEAPAFVRENGYMVNAVHAIDLSFALPGLIITAILLLKNHNLAFILTPVALVFIIILTFALIAMILMVKQRGISEDASVVYIFCVLTLLDSGFLYFFLRKLNPSDKNEIKK